MVLFSQMYLAERMFIRKVLLKREARRFKEKSANPPSWDAFESYSATSYSCWLFGNKVPTAHTALSALLFTIVSNGAMNKLSIYFKWPNEHFNPRMLLFSVGNGDIKAPRNWQRRNECSAMVATAWLDQWEYTSLWKSKCRLSIRRNEFSMPCIGETWS
jgi:hypothetical protein